MVSGLTTLLHSYFGSRLPLVQGGSFVYLVPALAIINSSEFQGLNEHVSLLFSYLLSFVCSLNAIHYYMLYYLYVLC